MKHLAEIDTSARDMAEISDKGNGKEAGCNGRTESNGYDEMDRIDE